MVRFVFSAIVLLNVSSFYSQQEQYIRPGTIKASSTISPSLMLNHDIQNIYLNGFISYQFDRKVSLRGESFLYIKNAASKPTDIGYSGGVHTYFGAFRHLTKGNWDNYLGFQPGVSIVQTIHNPGLSVCPSFALKAGSAFYVWKIFHFFAEVTYTNTSVRGITSGPYRADELILSAGLGYQVNTKRLKKNTATPQ